MKTIAKRWLVLLCSVPSFAVAASTFDIAHFMEQGNDLIMVVVPKVFDSYPPADKQQVSSALQQCAREARVSGKVVLVWPKAGGAMGFYGPNAWSPFLKSLDMNWILARINNALTCN